MNTTEEFDLVELTKNKWLKADDIPAEGLTLTISDARVHYFERDQVNKGVLDFLEISQALVLNKTRATSLKKYFGASKQDLVNKRIHLTTQPTAMGDTILIGKAPQVQPAQAAPNQPDVAFS